LRVAKEIVLFVSEIEARIRALFADVMGYPRKYLLNGPDQWNPSATVMFIQAPDPLRPKLGSIVPAGSYRIPKGTMIGVGDNIELYRPNIVKTPFALYEQEVSVALIA
jgi:hypothetical protein